MLPFIRNVDVVNWLIEYRERQRGCTLNSLQEKQRELRGTNHVKPTNPRRIADTFV